MVYTIAWLLFILGCILAVPIAALIESQQRKKAQREALMADEAEAEALEDDAEAVHEEEAIVAAEQGDPNELPADAASIDDAVGIVDDSGEAEPRPES
ncbi:hypothetical protein [Roseimaritima sediminicola]|uniref:hypothetical protein n=1 Tax=Roseimaritima sediminicola TaxID=2662066 RepID=UPI0012984DE1|nr:hypothetical protein [Roseimaritima sediminicola]